MKFHIEAGELTVRMEGGEALWALKRTLVVPRSAIRTADWHETFRVPRSHLGLRIGTMLPGVLFAGTFIARGIRTFLFMQQPRGLFGDIEAAHILELTLRDTTYNRMLLTVDDADMAEKIVRWARGRD
jgi:hypothetical protein